MIDLDKPIVTKRFVPFDIGKIVEISRKTTIQGMWAIAMRIAQVPHKKEVKK